MAKEVLNLSKRSLIEVRPAFQTLKSFVADEKTQKKNTKKAVTAINESAKKIASFM